MLHHQIETFYATVDLAQKIALTYAMTERVLAPVGGMWRTDEVLAFGDEQSRNLQPAGQSAYADLFLGSSR